MIKITDKNRCCGCSACMNICPKKAITMVEDLEGFKYPVIDEKKCVNCGMCKKTCPSNNFRNNISINKCYAAYSKYENKDSKSSSGGIFGLIASWILSKDGIVIGAAFDKNNILRHVAITNKEELDSLKGSKYIQSDLKNIFSFIKKNVENKIILFVGTPCQVAGLRAFLKKEYKNLICIDLFCHGVPSPKLFEKYVNELETTLKDKLVNYNFRDKNSGWDSYSNTMTFIKNNRTELYINNNYMKLFLSDVALRESCYNCTFKIGNKYSDITLGDFWGIKKHYPEMYNEKGVSAIIVNSEKGLNILNSIIGDLTIKECGIEDILDGNPLLKTSCSRPINRSSFYNDMNDYDISTLVKKHIICLPIYIRIINKIKRKIKKI